MKKIDRCKKCNSILNLTSADYGLVDYLCEDCWKEREYEKTKKEILN